MTDDLEKRLEAHASAKVPPVGRTFADRLESKLRVQHREVGGQRRPFAAWFAQWGLPRLGIAAAALAFGAIAVVALTGGSTGIPVDVIDGESPPPASAPSGVGGDDDQAPANDATPTAATVEGTEPNDPELTADPGATTPAGDVPTSPTTQPTRVATVAPTALPSVAAAVTDPPPTATVAPVPTTPPATPATPDRPAPTTTPAMPATPVPATPVPATAVPQPTRPVPRPTAIPTPTRPVPSPTEVPTPRPVVAGIDLSCEVRGGDSVIGVVCSWRPPQVDAVVTSYQVLRSRNGSQAQIVSRQRAGADTTYVDRDLEFGDQVAYLVRATGAGDELIAESARQIVRIPPTTD